MRVFTLQVSVKWAEPTYRSTPRRCRTPTHTRSSGQLRQVFFVRPPHRLARLHRSVQSINDPPMKLPHRFSTLAFAFYMAGIIAFVMSAVLTAFARGVETGYIWLVLKSYAMAFPVAFACVLAFRPFILFLVRKTVQGPPTVRTSDDSPPRASK